MFICRIPLVFLHWNILRFFHALKESTFTLPSKNQIIQIIQSCIIFPTFFQFFFERCTSSLFLCGWLSPWPFNLNTDFFKDFLGYIRPFLFSAAGKEFWSLVYRYARFTTIHIFKIAYYSRHPSTLHCLTSILYKHSGMRRKRASPHRWPWIGATGRRGSWDK